MDFNRIKDSITKVLKSRFGKPSDVRRLLLSGELNRSSLRTDAAEILGGIQTALSSSPYLRSRILDLALDDLLSEPLSPELVISEDAITLPPYPVHALVFSAFPHISHELYPLMIDAYTWDMENNRERSLQVAGIHENWLVGGSFTRAIVLEEYGMGLVEAVVSGSPSISSAQVLALNLREEHESHRRITEKLAGIPCLNPLETAVVLDNKAQTAAVWKDAGLETPQFILLDSGTNPDAIRKSLTTFDLAHEQILVIKPVDGTEGRGVTLVPFHSEQERSQAVRMVEGLLHLGAVMVLEHRGSLRYLSEGTGVRCAVRINVCWDGTAALVESGYAQVAPSVDSIASVGRGGKIVPLGDLWQNLVRPDGEPFVPGNSDWERLIETARKGAEVLAAASGSVMPALVGIDLLLDESSEGAVLPVLLEANPRPAGMSHSRFITPTGPTDEPGVTMHLWEACRRLQKRQSAR